MTPPLTTTLTAPEVQVVDQPEPKRAVVNAVLRCLLYFDIFHHPLDAKEIQECLSVPCDTGALEETLSYLLEQGMIHHTDGYFRINQDASINYRRKSGMKRSTASLQTAMRYSRLIAAFPFVRGISLSGSLSKGYMDEQSDIDYFIITAPGRLWLCRTLLVIFKKIFLLNSKKNFCINYFVSEDALSVPDHNAFTATEIAFVIPTYNYTLYRKFLHANEWYRHHYPNFPQRDQRYIVQERSPRIKRSIEFLLSGKPGTWLDQWCFVKTLGFWKRKFRHFDPGTFDRRLRSRRDVSKHNPLGYQDRVLRMLDDRLRSFEQQFELAPFSL